MIHRHTFLVSFISQYHTHSIPHSHYYYHSSSSLIPTLHIIYRTQTSLSQVVKQHRSVTKCARSRIGMELQRFGSEIFNLKTTSWWNRSRSFSEWSSCTYCSKRKRSFSLRSGMSQENYLAAVYASHGVPASVVTLSKTAPKTNITYLPPIGSSSDNSGDEKLNEVNVKQEEIDDDDDDDDEDEDLDAFETNDDDDDGKNDMRDEEIDDGKIMLKMLFAPINPSDINMIEGRYALLPDKLPYVAGNEGCGQVVKIGKNVDGFEIGDLAMPDRPLLGTWQTHLVVEAIHLRKVPSDVDPMVASCMSVNPTTSLRLLRDFVDLQPGDVIAQNGSTSAVGRGVIELANAMGYKTINIIRDGPNAEQQKSELYNLGATLVVKEGTSRMASKKAGLAEKAKLALNCIGGPQSEEVSSLLCEGGTMVTYGGMSKLPITLSTGKFIFKLITCKGFWLSAWTKTCTKEEKDAMFEELYYYIRKGFFKPKVEVMPLDLLSIAISMYEKKKVVLKLNKED